MAECTLKDGNYMRKLVALYDGRVALLSLAGGSGGGITLEYMEAEADRLATLASWENPEENPYYVTLFDEGSLLYANKEGVYRSGLSGENPELLYRWMNHGIITHEVSAMQADEEGRIALIYRDSENDNYLCLEPTTEEVPLHEITMEVSFLDAESYKWVVAEFNRRYPSCHIELVEHDFEDDTALLTQLTAGKGPVLIDPSLLGFEELEEMWEPLDTVMEQLGIAGELQSAALEMGKINGTLYAVVRDYYLSTVVAMDPDLKGWDYDVFFQSVQNRPELEAIRDYYTDGGGYGYLIDLLNHGLEDNYFLVSDAETGTVHFDSGRFRQVLDLAKKYFSGEENVIIGSALLEGKTLCNGVNILKPEYVAAYRIGFGDDAYYVGYPAKDGAAHFMAPSGMLSIRRSATKEEKEAAAAFMALCLSYEGQTQAAKDINFHLSVRRDVLEEQIAAMGTKRVTIVGLGEIRISSDPDIELDRQTLLDMIDQARPRGELPSELKSILSEELRLYFSGNITEEMLIDHLESRVGLYLGERN